MYPNFAQVIILTRDILGAPVSVFPDSLLLRWARRVSDELVSVFKMHQLPDVLVIPAPFTVNNGDTSIDLATAGWSDFGDIQLLEERPSGSSDAYTPMRRVDELSQRDPTDKIREYTNRDGGIQFVTPSGSVEIRAHYFASGNAEALTDTATIAVDDALNFLGHATAAKAGPGKGYTVEAQEAKTAAYGPNNPNPLAILGGYLQALVEPRSRVQQQTPVVPARYRAGGFR